MCWFASVGSWAWEHAAEWQRVQRGLLVYAGVLGAVLLLGGARLQLFPPNAETVRVASVTVDPGEARSAWNVCRKRVDAAALDVVRRETHRLHDSLLTRSEAEARAGARLVFWSELNGLVLKDDERALIDKGRKLARRVGAYLGMALGVFTPGQRLMENKVVVVDPAGEVVANYCKARPVPGDPETGASPHLPTVATPLGNLAFAICFDLDFPDLIRDAGRARADLLIVPASDPLGIDPIHTQMAEFRAIENGCALVRQANQGLSAATDHQGRILATMDYFSTHDRLLSAHVPTRGAATIYAHIGDVFAWGCVVGFSFVAARALIWPAD